MGHVECSLSCIGYRRNMLMQFNRWKLSRDDGYCILDNLNNEHFPNRQLASILPTSQECRIKSPGDFLRHCNIKNIKGLRISWVSFLIRFCRALKNCCKFYPLNKKSYSIYASKKKIFYLFIKLYFQLYFKYLYITCVVYVFVYCL